MKRVISLFLTMALLLSLASCRSVTPVESQTISSFTADELARIAVTASGRDPEALERLDDSLDEDSLSAYFVNYYGLEEGTWTDHAVYRAGGAEAFEVAVLCLTDETAAQDALEGLTAYIHARQGDFTGYSPEQADIVSRSIAFSCKQYAALFICEQTEVAQDAFYACFNGATPTPAPSAAASTAPGSEPSTDPATSSGESDPGPASPLPASYPVTYPGRTPFTPPNEDDMTIYDTSAILTAWDSRDPSDLSTYDRTIYEKAASVLDSVVKPGMSDFDKEYALYLWVITHMEYDWAHQNPLVPVSRDSFTPYGGLVKGKGVCLGFSAVFQLLMDMAGVECITIVGAAYNSEEDHAWNMVRLDGKWYCVDATWDWTYYNELGFMVYFNVTSDVMASTDHQWDYNSVPEATAAN